MRPYSGGPPRPKTRGGRRLSIASFARSRISARISSSYGGGSGSSRTPAARAARARVSASRGAAASGSQPVSSIVVVKAAPDDPMSQSYSAPVASASAYGKVVSCPSPNRRGPTSLRMRRLVRRRSRGTRASGSCRPATSPTCSRPLARACEPRISPCAGLLAIDPARRIEVLRIAHQTLDERLEPFVVAVPGHGDVSHDAPDEARRSVILVEDPVHPPAPGAAQLFENITRRASHARVAGIHAVLHEKKVRPVGRLVLGSPEVRARQAGVG